MRRTILLTVAALTLGACSQDTPDPVELADLETFNADFSSIAYGMDGVLPGAMLHELWRLKTLPEPIKLSAEQEASITKLLDDFQKANDADLKALTKVLDDTRKAIEAGKPNAEVRALFQQATTIRQRMRAALAKLKTDIDAVLATEQIEWLATRSPARCYPTPVAPLNAEQRTAIKTLREAYVAATAVDRAAVTPALEAARKARQQGKTAAEIKAILDPVRDALTRLQAAGNKLRADVWSVLTPAQRASGCFGPEPKTGT